MEDEPICVFSDVVRLPGPALSSIQRHFPTYQLRFSKTAQSKYYANTCPNCGVLSGDFYLHSEPGAPFFPTSEGEATHLILREVPIGGPVEIKGGIGMGAGDLILENAKRIDTE